MTMRTVITGGANGIGEAIAGRFLSDGARVAVVDRDAAALDRWRTANSAVGQSMMTFQSDVADPDAAQSGIRAVCDRWGGVDVLVYCAGLSRYEHVLDISVQNWRDILDVNLSGFFYWSKAVARPMVDQGHGRIVSIASVNSIAAEPSAAHYVASKGGVAALTRALAVDLGEYGITANAVAPGPILTPRNAEVFLTEPLRTQIARVPVGHPGSPSDVAAAVAWLATDEARMVNGHVLVVDGGLLARI